MNRRELAAAYLLDSLEPAERAELESRLADDAELRAEVEAARLLTVRLNALPGSAWPDRSVPDAVGKPTAAGAEASAASDSIAGAGGGRSPDVRVAGACGPPSPSPACSWSLRSASASARS